MPRINALTQGLVQSAIVDEYRLLFAAYVTANRHYRFSSLDLEVYGATLSRSVFPSIELASQAIEDEVGNCRFARAVFASNDVYAPVEAFVVGDAGFSGDT